MAKRKKKVKRKVKKKPITLILATSLIMLSFYLFPFGQDLAFMAVKGTLGNGNDQATWFWMYIITIGLFVTGIGILFWKHKQNAKSTLKGFKK